MYNMIPENHYQAEVHWAVLCYKITRQQRSEQNFVRVQYLMLLAKGEKRLRTYTIHDPDTEVGNLRVR